MKRIFESGDFVSNRITDSVYHDVITESRQFATGGTLSYQTTVFLSHKHQDLEDLRGIIGLLQNQFKAKVYIDSMDSEMPKTTNGVTAQRIKQIIKQSNKFILLATNTAIESTWCNWELGYGDAFKFQRNIAIFPIKPKGTLDTNYKGHEYMQIYPHIIHYSGFEKNCWGDPIGKAGYYVESYISNSRGQTYTNLQSLRDWLNDN
jgi:hypothetical protein